MDYFSDLWASSRNKLLHRVLRLNYIPVPVIDQLLPKRKNNIASHSYRLAAISSRWAEISKTWPQLFLISSIFLTSFLLHSIISRRVKPVSPPFGSIGVNEKTLKGREVFTLALDLHTRSNRPNEVCKLFFYLLVFPLLTNFRVCVCTI